MIHERQLPSSCNILSCKQWIVANCSSWCVFLKLQSTWASILPYTHWMFGKIKPPLQSLLRTLPLLGTAVIFPWSIVFTFFHYFSLFDFDIVWRSFVCTIFLNCKSWNLDVLVTRSYKAVLKYCIQNRRNDLLRDSVTFIVQRNKRDTLCRYLVKVAPNSKTTLHLWHPAHCHSVTKRALVLSNKPPHK